MKPIFFLDFFDLNQLILNQTEINAIKKIRKSGQSKKSLFVIITIDPMEKSWKQRFFP
jgi:hypothetical protein